MYLLMTVHVEMFEKRPDERFIALHDEWVDMHTPLVSLKRNEIRHLMLLIYIPWPNSCPKCRAWL